jgi:hypothetical protein
MLKLTKKPDYGLIALRHLALNAEGASAKEIAACYGIPMPLLAKVLHPPHFLRPHVDGNPEVLTVARNRGGPKQGRKRAHRHMVSIPTTAFVRGPFSGPPLGGPPSSSRPFQSSGKLIDQYSNTL